MALAGGVTTAVACPGNANLIGGTCAAVKTAGKTVSELVMVPELAFLMCLTDTVKNTYEGKRSPKTRLASAALIREALIKAKNYHTLWKRAQEDPKYEPPKFDMKLHSLMRVFDGMPVKITAKRSHDITTAIRIAEEFGLNYTLEDATESWLIPEVLKKHNVKCVVGPSYGEKNNENRYRDPIVGSVL
ncbi:MAG: amidohydrolase, partial [bacterium]|nr:amidohydrolase [bacterium]